MYGATELKQAFLKVFIVIFWGTLFFNFLYLPILFKGSQTDRSINVATWSDMIDEEMLQKFYEKSGISVNISYFDNNDELLVKMKATKGVGYDLIVPSDYAIQQLIQEDLLQPLDKKKFTNWHRIITRLLDCYFDPGNRYSIPYYWGIYGLGVDSTYFSNKIPDESWQLIFTQHGDAKIGMLDTPREALLLTAYYLFNSIDGLNEEKKSAIKNLLIEQKKWVEAYTEFRADYLLLSKASPIVVITTPFIVRLMKVNPTVDFIVPKEGSFMITDNWVIPKASTKTDLVYEFLNLLYQPEVITFHFNTFTFFPATVDLAILLQKNFKNPSIYNAHFNESIPLDFFRNVISKDVINDIWISLKAN